MVLEQLGHEDGVALDAVVEQPAQVGHDVLVLGLQVHFAQDALDQAHREVLHNGRLTR